MTTKPKNQSNQSATLKGGGGLADWNSKPPWRIGGGLWRIGGLKPKPRHKTLSPSHQKAAKNFLATLFQKLPTDKK